MEQALIKKSETSTSLTKLIASWWRELTQFSLELGGGYPAESNPKNIFFDKNIFM